jgi:LPS sulfotransferase NodH
MKSNFVIFAEPRTGSTALTSVLDAQKDVLCLSELFRENISNMKSIASYTDSFFPKDRSTWDKYRNENFKDFLNEISKKSNEKFFGYKIFEEHFKCFPEKEIYLNYLKETNTKIIILERKNILLQYISFLTATSIGIWITKIKWAGSQKVFQLNPVEVDYNEYIQYREITKTLYKDKLKIIKDYDLQYIHITYEDFTGKNFIESLKKIFNFLDLNFVNFIDVRKGGNLADHKKVNIYKLQDKIINYEKFKKAAEDNNDIETLNFLKEGQT